MLWGTHQGRAAAVREEPQLGPGSLMAMAAPIPGEDELSQAPPAFLGSSASYPELQADGAAPQSGVILDPN